MSVAALLDAAERQVHLRTNARQVHVTHAVLALVPEQAHGSVVFGDDRHRQAKFRIVVDAHGVFIGSEWNQRQVGTKNLFADRANAGPMVHAVDKGAQITAVSAVILYAAALKQDVAPFSPRQLIVALDFIDRSRMDDRTGEIRVI